MNEYNSIFLCISVRIFFQHTPYKKRPAHSYGPGRMRASLDKRARWTKQQHFGNSFFVFSLQRGGFFSTYIIIFFFFFQSLHERWGWGEKFCSIFFIFCKISIEIYAPEQSTSTISPIFGTSTNWYTNRWPSTLAKMPRW